MKSSRTDLPVRLADLFGYNDAILFGRARSGVLALLDILGLSPEAGFIMPANLCPSLLMAVHSSGTSIRLADVSELNGLASDDALVEAMQQASRPGIVMPTHLYGFVQPYPKTTAVARENGWFILENDTISTGVLLDGGNRRAIGDALLVSFGYAKGIEAGGGGALLTDDRVLARELRSRAETFPPLDTSALNAEEEFTLFARQLRNSQGKQNSLSAQTRENLLFERAPAYRYSFPENLEASLSAALNGFQKTIDGRRHKVDLWDHFLEPYANALLAPQAECIVPWRLIRRAPGIRDPIVSALRKAGIDAGTNFPPLCSSFPVLFPGEPPAGAERWGREVLNLWLSPANEVPQMILAANIIGDILSRLPRSGP